MPNINALEDTLHDNSTKIIIDNAGQIFVEGSRFKSHGD